MDTIMAFLHQLGLFNEQYLVPIWVFAWTAFKILGMSFALLLLYVALVDKVRSYNFRHMLRQTIGDDYKDWELDRYLRNLVLANQVYVFSHPLLLFAIVWLINELLKEATNLYGIGFLFNTIFLFSGVTSHLYSKVVIFRYARRMCREIQEDFWAYGLLMSVVPLGSYFASKAVAKRYYEEKHAEPQVATPDLMER